MAGSGQRIPSELKNLFAQISNVFEKYKDCKFESDAEKIEFDKFINEQIDNNC